MSLNHESQQMILELARVLNEKVRLSWEELEEALASSQPRRRRAAILLLERMTDRDPDTSPAVQWLLYRHLPRDRELVEAVLERIVCPN